MPIPFALPALARLRQHAVVGATALALGFGGLALAPALAQDAAPEAEAEAPAGPLPGDVIATVGEEEITEADMAFAAEDLLQELQGIPPAERRAFVLSVLIDMKVMAAAAREGGLDQTELFARQLSYMEDRALRREFFSDMVESGVTEERLQAAYDEAIADFEPQPEVRARHILVETEEEILSVQAEIEGGKSFEEAAAEHSIDGSRQNGGDLGYFATGMMVEPFEEAAFALEVGEMSEPVESQFGWHLIYIEDRRESSPPSLDQVRPQLSQQVLYETFVEIVNGLKDATEIVIPDAELAAQVEAQSSL